MEKVSDRSTIYELPVVREYFLKCVSSLGQVWRYLLPMCVSCEEVKNEQELVVWREVSTKLKMFFLSAVVFIFTEMLYR